MILRTQLIEHAHCVFPDAPDWTAPEGFVWVRGSSGSVAVTQADAFCGGSPECSSQDSGQPRIFASFSSCWTQQRAYRSTFVNQSRASVRPSTAVLSSQPLLADQSENQMLLVEDAPRLLLEITLMLLTETFNSLIAHNLTVAQAFLLGINSVLMFQCQQPTPHLSETRRCRALHYPDYHHSLCTTA